MYGGVTPLDLVGPLTVLRNLTGTAHRTVVVGERTDPLPTDTALRVVPAATFAEVSAPFAVIVPGAGHRRGASRRSRAPCGAIGLLAPVIAATPERLTRAAA